MKPKLSLLIVGLPYPPMTGGENISFHLAKELSRFFQLTIVGLFLEKEPSGEALKKYESFGAVKVLKFPKRGVFGRLVDQVFPFYFKGESASYASQLVEAVGDSENIFFHYFRPAFYFPFLKRTFPSRKFILLTDNVETQVHRDLVVSPSTGIRRLLNEIAQIQLTKFEQKVLRTMDIVFCLSENDRAKFETLYGRRPFVVPNGVDFESLQLSDIQSLKKILFVGSLLYGPNVEGLKWFVREVFDETLGTLTVVGKADPETDLEFLNRPGIEVFRSVPSVLPYLEKATLTIAPIFSGGGTRGKIIESLAAGRPVVSTEKGAEGLGLTPEHHFLLAETAADFKEAILKIFSDDQLRKNLIESGRSFVRDRHDWGSIGKEIQQRILE